MGVKMSLLKWVDVVNTILVKIAGIGFLFIIGITCADILFRIIWKPVFGAVELVMYTNAICVAFALGATQLKKGHIAVDILVNSFSKQSKKVVEFINTVSCIFFFGLVSWQIIKYATNLFKTGEVSETLKLPYYFFVYANALGCITLALVFITDLIKIFKKEG